MFDSSRSPTEGSGKEEGGLRGLPCTRALAPAFGNGDLLQLPGFVVVAGIQGVDFPSRRSWRGDCGLSRCAFLSTTPFQQVPEQSGRYHPCSVCLLSLRGKAPCSNPRQAHDPGLNYLDLATFSPYRCELCVSIVVHSYSKEDSSDFFF